MRDIRSEFLERKGEDGRQNGRDPLFDREWEVFVIRRDEKTGEFETRIVCCDDALVS